MASSSALCTLKERRQYEGSSVLQARQNMHEEQRASTQCTKEAQMRGHERSEEEDKSREREVDGGGGPQRRLMKKVASKLDVEDTWGALQVKEGMGYRKHERRGGDRSAARAERERVGQWRVDGPAGLPAWEALPQAPEISKKRVMNLAHMLADLGRGRAKAKGRMGSQSRVSSARWALGSTWGWFWKHGRERLEAGGLLLKHHLTSETDLEDAHCPLESIQ